MLAKLKSGKLINGRLAETFANLGIAVEVKETNTDESNEVVKNTTETTKRKRRTKAEIEADKKK